MEDTSNNTFLSKICAMILFSVCSVLIGLSPLFANARYIRKKKRNAQERHGDNSRYKCLLAEFSAFGGGVLLSTTFLHLLPEIRESIKRRQVNGLLESGALPLAEFLMCLGFLLLYLVEEVAHKIVIAKHKTSEPGCVVEIVNHTSKGNSDSEDIDMEKQSSTQEQGLCKISEENIVNKKCGSPLERSCHSHDKTDRVVFKQGCSKNYLLIFALSIHEAFEGLAIGLETEPEAVWYMILGVGAHKAVIAFCIGVQLVSAHINQKIAVVCILVFASATSIGIAIGLFLYTENSVLVIILQGLATGTLVHVVFFELLKPHTHSTPFSGVIVGFLSMAVLKYFTPSHS